MPENALLSCFSTEAETALSDPHHTLWRRAEVASIDRYWNGKSALRQVGHGWSNLTQVRSLWNEHQLFFQFEAWFDSLNVEPKWSTQKPTDGLWNKDVVEVFLRPTRGEDYFEVEVSPLGQWLDVHIFTPRGSVDYNWESNLTLEVSLDQESGLWGTFLALPCESLSAARPSAGHTWGLNFFRMTGQPPDRECLTWRPTFTTQPEFHVPSSFGHLIFVGSPP